MNERNQQDQRTWRQGRSKPHKYPCARCGGRLHAPGKHFSIGSLQAMEAKASREAARAAACGFGTGDTAVAAD